MASLHESKLIGSFQSSELDKVGDVSSIGPLGVVVFKIREPFMLSWNLRESLKFASTQKTFLGLQREILVGHWEFWTQGFHDIQESRFPKSTGDNLFYHSSFEVAESVTLKFLKYLQHWA